jgi:hypothetical protein
MQPNRSTCRTVTSMLTASALLLAAGTNIAYARTQKRNNTEAIAQFCAGQASLCMSRADDQSICGPRQTQCMRTGCFPHIAKFGGPVCASK